MKRTSIICLEVMLGIVAVTAILMVGTAWRLSQGPLSLKFLLPYAKEVLQDPKNPVRVDVGDVFLAWGGWERALDVRATGVGFRTPEGQRLALVREVSVSLSLRALLQGVVAPTSLEVIRPRLLLVRSATGDIELGFAEEESDSRPNLLPLLLDGLSGTPQPGGSLRYLNRITVVGGALRIQDRQTGVAWGARQADFSIVRRRDGLRTDFDLELNLPDSPHVTGRFDYVKAESRIDASIAFKAIDTAAAARGIPGLEPLGAFRTKVAGQVALGVGLDGRLQNGRFSLKSADGVFSSPVGENGEEKFRSISLDGSLAREPDEFRITRGLIELERSAVELSAVVTRAGPMAAVSAMVGVDGLPVDDLGKYWPPDAAPGGRAWVLRNIRGGGIRDATANIVARVGLEGERKGAVEVDSVNGRFAIADTTVNFLDPMPAITDAGVTATFSTRRFDFAIHSGRIGDIRLTDGVLNIWDIGEPRELLAVSADIEGPVADTLALLAHPRLKLLSKVGLDPAGAAGTHKTRLEIKLPLLDAITGDDVSVASTSRIDGLRLANVLKGQGISNGAVSLSVDNSTLRAEGAADYAATRVRFDWRENFSRNQASRRQFTAELVLDEALRRTFGIDFPDMVQGPVSARIAVQDRWDGDRMLKARANLAAAALSLPVVGVAKSAGQPGSAEVAVAFRKDRLLEIPTFAVEAGGFSTAGSLRFAGDGSTVQSFVIGRFSLDRTTFAGRGERQVDGRLAVSVKGQGFDARPLIADLKSPDTGAPLPAFRLVADFDEVWINDGAPATQVRLTLDRDADNWRQIAAGAVLADTEKPISVRLQTGGEGEVLTVYAPDAGAFVRALDISDAVRGGEIELRAVRAGGPERPWNGNAEMKRFRLAGAPNLARVLSLASLTGISDVLNGKEGIAFERFVVPFAVREGVATITDARAVGSELGITASGTIDLPGDALDIRGTLVPAYTLNSLIGKIPVIGDVLTGEKGGGIFAAAYRVKGPLDRPEASVNALSTLAPGFLRNLFGGGSPEKTTEPNVPASPPVPAE